MKKKQIAMMLGIILLGLLTSCSKDDNTKNQVNGDGAYYVKYETYFYHGSGPWFVKINYLSPDSLMQAWLYDSGDGNTFSVCAGPFSKGDRAYIGYEGTYNKSDAKYSIKNWLAISVKKGDGPFVIKKSVIDSPECEYIIE